MPSTVTDHSLLEALRLGRELDELVCPSHRDRPIGCTHGEMFVIALPKETQNGASHAVPQEFSKKDLFAFHAALDKFMKRHNK